MVEVSHRDISLINKYEETCVVKNVNIALTWHNRQVGYRLKLRRIMNCLVFYFPILNMLKYSIFISFPSLVISLCHQNIISCSLWLVKRKV